MTPRTTNRGFHRKTERSNNAPNYAEVIKYLNKIQDSAHPSRKTDASTTFYLY